MSTTPCSTAECAKAFGYDIALSKWVYIRSEGRNHFFAAHFEDGPPQREDGRMRDLHVLQTCPDHLWQITLRRDLFEAAVIAVRFSIIIANNIQEVSRPVESGAQVTSP